MTAGTVRCLLVAAAPADTREVARSIDRAPGLVLAGTADPVRATAGLRPACDVVLVLGAPDAEGGRLVRDLAAAAPGLPAVLVTDRVDEAGWRGAMAAGARGVVGAEPDPEELARAVRTAVGERTAGLPERSHAGRMVAVCGVKGGQGATTLAVGLGAAAGGLVIDASSGFAGIAQHLGCRPQRTLADLARLGGAVGGDAVAAVRTGHPSGFGLIAGLDEPELLDLLPGGLAAALARECRGIAPLSAFDLGVPASAFGFEAARCADTVVLVVTPDALSVRAAAACVGGLVRRGAAMESIALAVNRWRGSGELSLRAIEAAVGAEVLGVVRDDPGAATRFANHGEVPRAGRRRGLGHDLAHLAERVGRA